MLSATGLLLLAGGVAAALRAVKRREDAKWEGARFDREDGDPPRDQPWLGQARG